MLSPFLSDIAGLEDSGLSFSVSEFLSSERFLDEVISNKYNIDGEEKTLVEHWGKHYNKYLHLNPLNTLATINRNMIKTQRTFLISFESTPKILMSPHIIPTPQL